MDDLLAQHSLRGAHVHLPADSRDSAFTRYFEERFAQLGIRRLTALCYSNPQRHMFDSSPRPPAMLFERTAAGTVHRAADEDGSWRSAQGLGLIAEADFVTTNPPFSHIKYFLPHLSRLGGAFTIIAPLNAYHYRRINPYIMSGAVGVHKIHNAGRMVNFLRPDGTLQTVAPIGWFSSLPSPYPIESVKLTVRWCDSIAHRYPRFDPPYQWAREVGKLADIPLGYDGVLGVPPTYMFQPDPRFERINFCKNTRINGRQTWVRVFIRQVRD